MMGFDFGRGGKPLRIAVGRIFHEANAHSPLFTEREDFERMHHLEGAALEQATWLKNSELKDFMPHAELTGFRQAAAAAGNVETVPLTSSLAVPSGPLSAACFAWLLDGLLERLAAAGKLDGVYLALHGSMQVHGLDRAPEAEIIARVRAVIGDEVKLAVSYDLHANLSPGMVDPVDILTAYRTNPHWDLAPTGFRAGNRLIRTLRGQCRPTSAWRKLPLILGGGITIDFLQPMRGVFRFMKRLERNPKVLSTSLFMVHPYTAAEDLGWAVHVCTDGDADLANRLADQLADKAWAQRDVPMPAIRTIDEALEEVRTSIWRKLGPVSIVDVGDVVGAGAPGGSTQILESLTNDSRGLRAFVPVHDPGAIDALWDKELGQNQRVTFRGTPGYKQAEVSVDAKLVHRTTTDFGRTLRVDTGSISVAITERSPLPIHPSFWRDLLLNPRDADVVIQKNFFHYRMFYAATSFRHIPVGTAGATNLSDVMNRTYRVPVHPQTKIDDWRTFDPDLRHLSGPRPSGPPVAQKESAAAS